MEVSKERHKPDQLRVFWGDRLVWILQYISLSVNKVVVRHSRHRFRSEHLPAEIKRVPLVRHSRHGQHLDPICWHRGFASTVLRCTTTRRFILANSLTPALQYAAGLRDDIPTALTPSKQAALQLDRNFALHCSGPRHARQRRGLRWDLLEFRY